MSETRQCLFPTDFGPLAHAAAPVAASYISALGGCLHVVHVIQPMVLTTGGSPILTHAEAIPVVDRSQTEADLAEFCARHFGGLTPPPKTMLLTGPPAAMIADYAAAHAIDLLIVPTHADGMLKRVLLGSVSKSLLESASCPVLMIPSASL